MLRLDSLSVTGDLHKPKCAAVDGYIFSGPCKITASFVFQIIFHCSNFFLSQRNHTHFVLSGQDGTFLEETRAQILAIRQGIGYPSTTVVEQATLYADSVLLPSKDDVPHFSLMRSNGRCRSIYRCRHYYRRSRQHVNFG